MLEGKTIVITGAASGLGRAWARGFLDEGAVVVGADINEKGLTDLAESVGPGFHPITTDVANPVHIKRMIDFAVERTGRVDVLFNNAGLAYQMTLEEAPDGAFEAHVAVHLFGCVNGMRAALPHMRRQNYGRIINTISRGAETDVPRTSAYAASKAAIWAASRVTAREVANCDILVNLLVPGPTNTAIWGIPVPNLQPPEATYPTARMLATFPAGGPTARVYWDEKEYPLFNPDNEVQRIVRTRQ